MGPTRARFNCGSRLHPRFLCPRFLYTFISWKINAKECLKDAWLRKNSGRFLLECMAFIVTDALPPWFPIKAFYLLIFLSRELKKLVSRILVSFFFFYLFQCDIFSLFKRYLSYTWFNSNGCSGILLLFPLTEHVLTSVWMVYACLVIS